jgi:hypothetical protein
MELVIMIIIITIIIRQSYPCNRPWRPIRL